MVYNSLTATEDQRGFFMRGRDAIPFREPAHGIDQGLQQGRARATERGSSEAIAESDGSYPHARSRKRRSRDPLRHQRRPGFIGDAGDQCRNRRYAPTGHGTTGQLFELLEEGRHINAMLVQYIALSAPPPLASQDVPGRDIADIDDVEQTVHIGRRPAVHEIDQHARRRRQAAISRSERQGRHHDDNGQLIGKAPGYRLGTPFRSGVVAEEIMLRGLQLLVYDGMAMTDMPAGQHRGARRVHHPLHAGLCRCLQDGSGAADIDLLIDRRVRRPKLGNGSGMINVAGTFDRGLDKGTISDGPSDKSCPCPYDRRRLDVDDPYRLAPCEELIDKMLADKAAPAGDDTDAQSRTSKSR